MFDFMSPITYNTGVNEFLYGYYNSLPHVQSYKLYTFGKASEPEPSYYSPKLGPTYSFGSNKTENDYFGWSGSSFGRNKVYNFTGTGISPTYKGAPATEETEEAQDKDIYPTYKAAPISEDIDSDAVIKSTSSSKPAANAVIAVDKTETVKNIKPKIAKKKAVNNNDKLRKSFVTTASKYMGCNEKDGSFKKFSDSPEWCADFVTYVVKEAYKNSGIPLPEGFGHHRCEIIKQWAIDNNVFLKTAGKQDKAEIIANKVRPGDIVILRENGASHIGFVSEVAKNGYFKTIEGNLSVDGVDKVAENSYSPYHKDISGFVQLV